MTDSIRFALIALVAALLASCGGDDPAAIGPVVTDEPDTAVASDDTGPVDPVEPTEFTPVPDVTQPADAPPLPAFSVQGVFPNRGHVWGGETVAVVGSGFDVTCNVLFDGSPGSYVLFVDKNRLHVNTPAHSPGSVTVTVISGSGRVAELESAFLYYNEVDVQTVTPAAGPADGGTPVTVTGLGFTPDSFLIFGQHKALSTQVLDDNTILALTPPGSPGYSNVVVSNHLGVHGLKDGFYYTKGATIDAVNPAAGPTAGGQQVAIVGDGFGDGLKVWFGSTPATDAHLINDQLVTATTPAGAGVVDVRVDGVEGTAVLDDAYRFVDAQGGALQVLHVAPKQGKQTGGTLVAIAVDGALDPDDTTVSFGGVNGDIVEVDPATSSVLVTSPPGAPGLIDITVGTGGQQAIAKDAFTYIKNVSVSGITPAEGPEDGGGEVFITGNGFAPDSTVFIGALVAPVVSVEDGTLITAIAPPGSPGQFDVRVVAGSQQAVLPKAYTYVPDTAELYVVLPDHGAIAGGTWVQVIGAGFPEDATVDFGGVPATDVKYKGPGFLTVRTPPNGIATVAVDVKGTGAEASLDNAYTYYDPKSTFGGTWGDGVDVAVNVTVLDGTIGTPVGDAFVFLDNDPVTPYQGFTNGAGQITFSGPDLGGAHTISVSKEGYVTYSVVHFNAENVTVFLQRFDEPQPGLSDLVAPAGVQGKVVDLDKYVAGVPGPCTLGSSTTDPTHCAECDPEEGCGDSGALCADLGVKQGWHCLQKCEEDADCPKKAVCQLLAGAHHCMPTPGPKVAVCTGTKPFFRFFDVPLGPGAMANEDGVFTIIAFPTEIAVVCFGGFYLKNDEPTAKTLEKAIKQSPNGVFQPVAMGVVRHLLLKPGQVALDVEVKLNIPLKRTIHTRMEKPPLEDTDYLWAQAYLNFGSDGYVKIPYSKTLYKDEPFLFDTMPTALSGDIADATYTFYAGANSYWDSLKGYFPRAYVVRQGVVEPQDDRMLRLVEGTWGTTSTGLTESQLGAHTFSANSVITVGTGGSVYKYDGTKYLWMPTDTTRNLRGVHGLAEDDMWAVGDKGTLVHFNGAVWSKQPIETEQDLRDVRVESDGTIRIVGNQVVLERAPGQDEWKPVTQNMGYSWYAIDSTSASDVWIAGSAGQVRHFDGLSWSTKPLPIISTLRAITAIAPNDVWFAGEGGRLVHYDGWTFQVVEPVTSQTLNALAHRGSGEVVAAGGYGTVLTYDGSAWVPAPVGDYNQDLHAVSLPDGTSDTYTFGDHQLILGPIVAPARVSTPEPGGVLETNAIEWTADDRVEPHYQRIEIMIPGPMGPILIWELVADGEIGLAELPDFAALEGTPGLMTGDHLLRITRVYQEGFDIDQFNYKDLGDLDKQSWAIEYFPFTTPEP